MIDERRPDRRGALVAAAYARIATAGFEGLRTRDVAADVGVNIATLHYYFPSKEALIRAVIGYAVGRFQATMPGEGSAVDQLRAHLRAIAELLRADPRLWAVMSELVLRAPRDTSLADIFRQTDGYWHRTLAELIQRCIDAGAVAPDLDASGTARLLIVAIKGMSLPALAGDPSDIADQVFTQFERLLGLDELH
ncbi:MAG: TetR/AcrR family transcriptional regulator [Chloroflexi bacterium]|nr:TetR/AcrR family transcriptional regulator [Chloroflexota bacterium]